MVLELREVPAEFVRLDAPDIERLDAGRVDEQRALVVDAEEETRVVVCRPR
jgi:hypothetical protein